MNECSPFSKIIFSQDPSNAITTQIAITRPTIRYKMKAEAANARIIVRVGVILPPVVRLMVVVIVYE